MTVYRFQKVSVSAYKSGLCAVCGKRAERSRTFTNTVNPFNKNPDGSIRTRAEVWQCVSDLARAWKASPVVHARCES